MKAIMVLAIISIVTSIIGMVMPLAGSANGKEPQKILMVERQRQPANLIWMTSK